jgi:hypothetical protein
MPVTLGMEVDAASWLAFRGSVSQNVLINSEKKTDTGTSQENSLNSTSVNGGATLNFGALKVDGMVGATNNAELHTDTLMTKVAATYSF